MKKTFKGHTLMEVLVSTVLILLSVIVLAVLLNNTFFSRVRRERYLNAFQPEYKDSDSSSLKRSSIKYRAGDSIKTDNDNLFFK